MLKPTKPCLCGANDWQERPDGGWSCGRCLPSLKNEVKVPTDKGHCEHGEFILSEGCPQCIASHGQNSGAQYSPEVLALRGRVILGNKKLNDAWEKIRGMVKETEEWSQQMEIWHQANEKLSLLCAELKVRGYEDCLYREDQGRKTVRCLEQGDIGCRVCPSKIPYWEQELMELPGPGRRS